MTYCFHLSYWARWSKFRKIKKISPVSSLVTQNVCTCVDPWVPPMCPCVGPMSRGVNNNFSRVYCVFLSYFGSYGRLWHALQRAWLLLFLGIGMRACLGNSERKCQYYVGALSYFWKQRIYGTPVSILLKINKTYKEFQLKNKKDL